MSTHMKVIQSLLNVLCTKQEVSKITSIINNLLALSYIYWLYINLFEKKKKHKKSYNKHLHYFIKDLIITFLALRCQFRYYALWHQPFLMSFFSASRWDLKTIDAYLLILKHMLQTLLNDTSFICKSNHACNKGS